MTHSGPIVPPADHRGWPLPALVAGLLQLGLMGIYVARYDGDVSAFVCAGSDLAQRWPLEHVRVSLSKEGFDGQFYYILARAPWTKQDAEYVDVPACRHLRILYPALAWLFSGLGDPTALLWVMPVINLLAFAGMAGLGACFAVQSGRSRWWGLLTPLLLNAGAPALRNLTDPLATAAVLGVLVVWQLRWNSWSLFLFATAAVFSRETNLAVVGIVLAMAVLARDWTRAGGLFVILVAWAGWVVLLWTMYDDSPFVTGNFGLPFQGIMYRLQHFRGDAASAGAPIHAVGLAFIGIQVSIALAMPLLRANHALTLTALCGAAIAVCAGQWLYLTGHTYTRVTVFLPLGILLWGLQSGRTWPLLALSPAVLWLAYAVFQVWAR